MRIAHLIHFDGDGGGPRSVINQLRYFRPNHDQVVFHGARGRIAEFCESEGITHYRLALDKKVKCILGFWEVYYHLKTGRPDILILHGQWAGPVGALAGRLARVPRIIYIARWPAFYTDWNLWLAMRNYCAEKMPCRLADRIITLTPSSRYQYLLRGWAAEDRLRLIPNSIYSNTMPIEGAVDTLRRQLGFQADVCNVVAVGRLSDQKRVLELLAIWRRVINTGLRARLWIVGSGPDEKKMRRLGARLGLGENCVFTGMRPDALEFIAAADIFVLDSMYESFGNAVLEAMSCGKPVIVSRVDGLRDLLTDGVEGRLIDPWEDDMFVEVLVDLITHSEKREAMGQQGRLRARKFRPEIVFKGYEDLFREFAANGDV